MTASGLEAAKTVPVDSSSRQAEVGDGKVKKKVKKRQQGAEAPQPPARVKKKRCKTVASASSRPTKEAATSSDLHRKGKKRRADDRAITYADCAAGVGAKAGAKTATSRDGRLQGGAANPVDETPDQGWRKKSGDKNHLKVFVGGIPFGVDLETLKSDFAVCGEIDDFAYPKDDKGRFKGIAFFTFKTREAVDAALAYDGDLYGGRSLKVAMATPRGGKPGGDAEGGRDGGKGSKGKSKDSDGGSKGKREKGKSKSSGGGKGNKGTRSKGKKQRFGFELSSEDE